MTCLHPNTKIYNSRRPGEIGFQFRFFPYVKFRTRRCLDCDHTFNTYEVTDGGIAVIAASHAEEIRQRLLELVGRLP